MGICNLIFNSYSNLVKLEYYKIIPSTLPEKLCKFDQQYCFAPLCWVSVFCSKLNESILVAIDEWAYVSIQRSFLFWKRFPLHALIHFSRWWFDFEVVDPSAKYKIFTNFLDEFYKMHNLQVTEWNNLEIMIQSLLKERPKNFYKSTFCTTLIKKHYAVRAHTISYE